jgi:hypothetical protein
MTVTGERLERAREGLAARLNAIITPLSGRNDVLLRLRWDLPDGTPPGWWVDTVAEVNVNADVTLGGTADPDDVNPATRRGRLRHPVLIGVTAHEAAHARATRWRGSVPDGTPGLVLRAAALLEEPRAEGRQIRRRPGDRLYLRAAARHLVQIPAAGDEAGTGQDRWRAAAAIALLCGRAAAGVLGEADVTDVRAGAAAVLGAGVVAQLDVLVREAIRLRDGDGPGLAGLARRWLEVIGIPETSTGTDFGEAGCGAGASPDDSAGGSAPGEPGTDPMGVAIAAAAAAIADAAAGDARAAADAGAALPRRDQARVDARAAEAADRAAATRAAASVFTRHGRTASGPGSPVTGTRPPTSRERAAANRLAAALRRAGYRGPDITRVASATPPGRLIGRDALAAHAQRELGLPVTALPFRTRIRRHVERPAIRVGLAADVSGSMRWIEGPVAAATWIIAAGAAQVRGQVAAVAFGHAVTSLAAPGVPPTAVPILAAHDGEEAFTPAIRALDGALGLSTGTGVRLLFIASDGELVIPGEEPEGRRLVARLARAGVGVLWLDSDGDARVMPGAVRVPLAAAADAATVIGQAVVEALGGAGTPRLASR